MRHKARMNGPEETEAMEMALGISGPIGYKSQCGLWMLLGTGRDGKSIAILEMNWANCLRYCAELMLKKDI